MRSLERSSRRSQCSAQHQQQNHVLFSPIRNHRVLGSHLFCKSTTNLARPDLTPRIILTRLSHNKRLPADEADCNSCIACTVPSVSVCLKQMEGAVVGSQVATGKLWRCPRSWGQCACCSITGKRVRSSSLFVFRAPELGLLRRPSACPCCGVDLPRSSRFGSSLLLSN